MISAPSLKSCRQCGKQFTPAKPLQYVCGLRCATVHIADAQKAKKATARALTRERKEAAKPRGKLLAEAQSAFNAFIRARDAGRLCICCGKPMEPMRPGGSVDAGHYLSIGAAPHLRFDEANVHAQRKSCNRPGGAKRAAFRAHMIERVGLEEVERLESDQTLRKWTADELRAIRDDYKRRVKNGI